MKKSNHYLNVIINDRFGSLLIFLLIISPILIKAQQQAPSREIIYKDWQMLGESPAMMDVSYRIVQCSGGLNQIHLFLFNESSKDQMAHFNLTISNTKDRRSFKKEISFSTMKGDMIRVKCNSPENFNDLKIDLPEDYDPNDIIISITF